VKRRIVYSVFVAFAILVSGCGVFAPEPTATPTPSNTPTNTITPSPTLTFTPTYTPTETLTPTITPTLTPDFIWGVINVAMASCRFGPGGGYLLRTTLYEGDKVEVVGHMELNQNWWFLHKVSRPDFNCWVSQELVDLGAEPSRIPSISDPHRVLPWTTQPYGPLKGVSASRSGSIVTVRWEPFEYLPGDDSLQNKYLVESWVCQDGQFVFRAYGTNKTSIDIQDETACGELSRGRAFGSDKHGYTNWVTIPWPQ
jgi:hypothetical protein